MTRSLREVLRTVCVVLVLLVSLWPGYWMLITAFKTDTEILTAPPTLIPMKPVLTSFRELLSATRFPRYILNSLMVAGITVAISTVLGTSAGYSLSRYNFPGKKYLGRLILFAYLFPGVLLMVPMYVLVSSMGMLDNVFVLPVIHVTFTAPFYSWLLKSFFDKMPENLEDAAMIDGASQWQVIWRVIVPLSKPGVAGAALWTFIHSWQEYMFATVLLSSDHNLTASVGLSRLLEIQGKFNWGLLNAAAVVVALPVLILFAFLGRSFVAGLAAGSGK